MKVLIALFISLIAIGHTKGAMVKSIDSLKYELSSSNSAEDSLVALIALSRHYNTIAIDSTFYFGKIALVKADKLNDTASLAEIYKYFGVSCYYAAMYEKALEYSQQSNEFYQIIRDEVGIAKTYNNMGIIYEVSGKYDIALEHYNKSLDIWHQIIEHSPEDNEAKSSVAYLYNNIGIVYSTLGHVEKGKDFYDTSYTIANKYNDKKCMSLALLNLGNLLIGESAYQLALDKLFQSLQLSEELGDKQGIAISMGSISDVYLKLKNYEKTQFYIKKVLAVANDIQANELIMNAYENMYLFNMEVDNPDSALKYQTLYHQLYDSIYSLESKSRIAELQQKYEFEKKEKEISLLKAEQEIKDIRLKNSQRWLAILIGGILVSLFFLGLIYFQMKQKVRANNELVKKNLEIVESEEFIRDCLKKEQQKEPSVPEQNLEGKYAGSSLTEQQKEELQTLISNTIEIEKLYLKSDFTIDTLSKYLTVSRTYISQVINEKLNMNFNAFINEYRVKEARRMLTDEANKNLTIETIALSVGFGSKSSFNTAFKKYTGITPSFYMKSSM